MKNQGIISKFQRGNAFIIILIIIALLGALTVTMTRMGENENNVNQEEANIVASQVLRQAKTLSNAVDGLLAKGCSITQLSFENPVVTGYQNVQSPPDKSCWLFNAAGAGLAFPIPPKNANDKSDWLFVRNNKIAGVGLERETGNLPTGQSQDLLMVLSLVDINVCKAINSQIGLSRSYLEPPPAWIVTVSLERKFYAGSTSPNDNNYSSQGTTGAILRSAGSPHNTTALWDQKTACVEAANGYTDMNGPDQPGVGKYFFYQVLVER